MTLYPGATSGPADYRPEIKNRGEFPFRNVVKMKTEPEGILNEPIFSDENVTEIADWSVSYSAQRPITEPATLTVYYYALMLRGDIKPYSCADSHQTQVEVLVDERLSTSETLEPHSVPGHPALASTYDMQFVGGDRRHESQLLRPCAGQC
jgi:hypothetical protein